MSIVRNPARALARTGQEAASARPGIAFNHALWTLLTVVLIVAIALSACSRRKSSSNNQGLSKRVFQYGQPVPKGGGRYKVGSPYKIAWLCDTPRE